MDLDKLFDSPTPPRPARPSTSTPLFFTSPTPSPRRIPNQTAALSLFDDLDEDDAPPPPLPRAADGSAAARDWVMPPNEADGLGGDPSVPDGGLVKKPRAPLKVSVARLEEPIGLPRLVDMSKNRTKLKGKGHEREDLNALMNDYRLWTHQLFPKTTFESTVRDVEKICHKRTMNHVLNHLQTLYTGPLPASEDEGPAPSHGASPRSRTGSHVPAATSVSRTHPSSSSPPPSKPQAKDRAPIEDDEDGWEVDEMSAAAETRAAPPVNQPVFTNEDEEDWSILDEMENEGRPAVLKGALPVHPTDEEEADWAMFDEAHGT